LETRTLGRTGLTLSALGFGCGAVGGLMVRGSPADQERAVARAIESGVTYFDTAPQYGNGASEENLGRVLRSLRPAVTVGTKVRIPEAEFGNIGGAIATALERSLSRIGRDSVDLYQLHNPIAPETGGPALGVRVVLDEVASAFARLREQGKVRFCGITAVGETAALAAVIDSRAFDSAQVSYNMLNPSAGRAVPAGYPAQDYAGLIGRAARAGMGVINIRVLAGGALSGREARHPIASPPPEPIGSGASYRNDVARAQRLSPLVAEGFAGDLPEAALRFALAERGVSTVLIGMSTLDEFEAAVRAVNKGPLAGTALRRLQELQDAFVGESR